MDSTFIGGLDECGTGAVAGPACVAVTVFPQCLPPIPGVKDSKQLTRGQRKKLFPQIVHAASWLGVGWCSNQEIDELGLGRAWALACERALDGLPPIDLLIVDGNRAAPSYHGAQRAVVKGDALHWQVSAASIIAKQLRDAEMTYLAQFFPHWDWTKNVGYGTEGHRQAILEHGFSPFHRLSFLHGFINARQSAHPSND